MIAFKEWTLLCDALGSGEQSLILRKGGIAEGRGGFEFKHAEFALFPTHFHEQVAKLKLPPETVLPAAQPGTIMVAYAARLEWSAAITDLETAQRFAPFHIWRDEVVAERFGYGEERGLHLAFVRVYRIEPMPIVFAEEKHHGGCRSWVTIPDPPHLVLTPVIGDAENARRSEELKRLCEGVTAFT